MKILITGGAGFIGSHLARRLEKEGNDVFIFDNFSSGSEENIKDIKAEVIRGDVITGGNMPKVDEIYHLASLASPLFYQNDPVGTSLSNSLGTYNLLMHAKKTGARFLFASTSEVYGDPLEHPQKETYWGNVNPNGIRSCYDESKRFGESITMTFHRKHDVDTRIVRIFNTYGPYMGKDDGRIIPNFIMQALKNEDITIYGDGTQTRSLCFVSDTVDGIIRLMRSKCETPINIGNPNELTVKEIAEKIKALVGARSLIVYKELPEDDPKKRCPNISKAKEILGWNPTIPLNEGLKQTIEYFKTLEK